MRKVVLLLFSGLLLMACGEGTPSADLSLKLEKGKTYKHIIKSKRLFIQELSGQKQEESSDIEITLNYKVTDSKSGTYTFETDMDDLSMTFDISRDSMVVVSSGNKSAEDPFTNMLIALTKETFTVLMDDKGNIKDFKDMDKLWTAASERVSYLPGDLKEPLMVQLQATYGEESLHDNLEYLTAVLPDKQVKESDAWTVHKQLNSDINVEIDTKYRLTELTDTYALITGTGTVTSDSKKIKKEGETEIRYDLGGTMNSEIKIDRMTGWVLEAQIKQSINGEGYLRMRAGTEEIPVPVILVNEMYVTN